MVLDKEILELVMGGIWDNRFSGEPNGWATHICIEHRFPGRDWAVCTKAG